MRFLSILILTLAGAAVAEPQVDRIRVPEGFAVSLFADAVPGARTLRLGPGGTVFVGTRGEGTVYALRDDDGDGRAERQLEIANGLDSPNGLAVHDGDLYVAEIGRIRRYPDIETHLEGPHAPETIYDDLPEEAHHGWRYMGFGPDGYLYVAVGAPCNVCDRFGEIRRLRPDGTEATVFARGVRNSVGFDWHPATGELWFTDNGRDGMGDNVPPDELNRAPQAGLHFGFPFCHGGDIPDPNFTERSCAEFVPPAQRLGPHVAALGMRFYTGERFPPAYRGQIFIAEHGSWDRSEKIGYRVTLVRLQEGEPVSYETFADGFIVEGEAWGRPVDVLVMPDGALLVSDDQAGAVYRIDYTGA